MPPLDKKIKKFLKNSIRVAPTISNKGELAELRTGLVSPYPQTRKDAIKKTIQQMTLAKDVSSLFPDVLKNIATNDIEQKKLVYLYVMNYAETHPELCILAVNTFITDAQDPNPLIRCMAIRTMSMIRVDKILEYIEVPLRRTLQDDNPYVRKTAVICVAKLFQLNRDLCIELGVLEDLVHGLDDQNPMVIANAIASLTEINAIDPSVVDLVKLTQTHVSQFLSVLNECTEWARITILGALSEYNARDSIEAKDIIDRVTAHLQHVNPAVVLATIKVILKNAPMLDPSLFNVNSLLGKKITSALVSLMSTPHEIQYVALKNIRIVLEKYPELLTKELRIFYVKFNDPLYVKIEKIEILVRLVDPSNIKQCTLLLNELKEYAMEFEPEFVTRAIQGLAQLGIKYSDPVFIQKVLDVLCGDLLERGQESIKNDCCIAMCSLLRHCPDNVEMGKQVCSIFNAWSSPETVLQTDVAKCNYVWLMGVYPQHFPSLGDKIDGFVQNFTQEETLTQLSLLITVVRLHSRLDGAVLPNVFEAATNEAVAVDVRDLAMIYWRCFSMEGTSDKLIEDLCTASLPKVDDILNKFSPEVLEKLLGELGTISSIYYKPSVDSERRATQRQHVIQSHRLGDLEDLANNELSRARDDVLLDFDSDNASSAFNGDNKTTLLDELDDIFNLDNESSAPAHTITSPNLVAATEGMQNLSVGSGPEGSDTKKVSSTTQDLLNLF